jgi:EAL domain-containing protein (putative c-di-GMP-specific phosphodiesterase class I)
VFPVDILKMDRSFLSSHEGDAVAGAIVALGESLRLDVVAEGIERPEQLASLRDLGCRLGQGFPVREADASGPARGVPRGRAARRIGSKRNGRVVRRARSQFGAGPGETPTSTAGGPGEAPTSKAREKFRPPVAAAGVQERP